LTLVWRDGITGDNLQGFLPCDDNVTVRLRDGVSVPNTGRHELEEKTHGYSRNIAHGTGKFDGETYRVMATSKAALVDH
jgi:hypothetical protein